MNNEDAIIEAEAELQKMNACLSGERMVTSTRPFYARRLAKRWRDFGTFDHMSYTFHDYLGAFQAELWMADAEELVQVVGDDLWVHENVAVQLAQWLSVEVHLALLDKFCEAKWGGPPSQARLNELVKPRVTT